MSPPPAPSRVVIVGKTRMGGGSCIGGIVESTGKPVRLIPINRVCHPPEPPFNIGDIWSMRLRPRDAIEAPHTEDTDEWDATYVGRRVDLAGFIKREGRIHEGPASGLFDGRLRFRESGSGYLLRVPPIPTRSVEFWIVPHPLTCEAHDGKARYILRGNSAVRIPYVGFEPPVSLIPAGTLVRMSLARWWTNLNDPSEGETCSLQLSGWFDLPPEFRSPAAIRPPSHKIQIAAKDIPY